MATKEQLIGEAEALGAKLGVSVETDGLSRPKLLALVKDLKAQAEPAEAKADTEPPPPAPKPKPATGRLVVGAGRALYCARGQLKAGAEIRDGDFDAATLDKLRGSGMIVDG
jgi:hypothetical protein